MGDAVTVSLSLTPDLEDSMSQLKRSPGNAVVVAGILLMVLLMSAACAMPVPGQTAPEAESP